jgi:hypothetical protein
MLEARRSYPTWVLSMGLVGTGLPLQVPGVSIAHEPLLCFVANQYPVLEARFTTVNPIRSTRAYFKSHQHREWYYVGFESPGDPPAAALPKPLASTKEVDYYLEVIDSFFQAATTGPFTARVVDDEDQCERRPAAGILTGGVPQLRLFGTAAGQSPVPPGFAAEGIHAFTTVNGAVMTGASLGGAVAASGAGISTGAMLGIVGGGVGAAAAVVAATGGDDAQSAIPPAPPAQPGPSNCSPTGALEFSVDFPASLTGMTTCMPANADTTFRVRNPSCSAVTFSLSGVRIPGGYCAGGSPNRFGPRTESVNAGQTWTLVFDRRPYMGPQDLFAFGCCWPQACGDSIRTSAICTEDETYTVQWSGGSLTQQQGFSYDFRTCPRCNRAPATANHVEGGRPAGVEGRAPANPAPRLRWSSELEPSDAAGRLSLNGGQPTFLVTGRISAEIPVPSGENAFEGELVRSGERSGRWRLQFEPGADFVSGSIRVQQGWPLEITPTSVTFALSGMTGERFRVSFLVPDPR